MDDARDEAAERARQYVALQAVRLRSLGPAAAEGDDDAVHDARTATRRLRTALRVCAPLVPDGRRLRDALRGVGRALGAVRDPAVELAWLREALDPDEDARAAARLVEGRLVARQAGLVVLRRQLRSAAHARLLADLEAAVRHTWPPDEGRLVRRAGREWHRLDRALAAAGTAGHDERDAALHAARRQARRARYAAELMGAAAVRSVERAEQVQETLGRQHDAVLVRAVIAEVAAQARAAGEDLAAYDRLATLARRAADRAQHDARAAARHARATGHRGWMP